MSHNIIEFPISSSSGIYSNPESESNNIVPFSKDVLLKESIHNSKSIHAEALTNSRKALVSEMIKCTESQVKNKSFDETKKLITNFREKVAAYPKYISYEGSMVLCVLISIGFTHSIHLEGLPEEDKKIIISFLPDDFDEKMKLYKSWIDIKFDDSKDFLLTYHNPSSKDKNVIPINLFNTIIHSNPNDNPTQYVPIENDGEKISLGGKITLDKKSMVEKIGIVPSKNKDFNNAITEEEIVTSRRNPVSGRNAFEIREDILEAAIDVIKYSNPINDNALSKRDINATTDEILYVAKKFYSFVENRSR